MGTYFWTLCVVGFVLTLMLFKLAAPYAEKHGLVDKPGGRKTHEGSIPVIGGLVILPVFSLLFFVSDIQNGSYLFPLIIGVFALLFLGVMDDRFQLKPWARFILQIWIACYIVIFCGAELTQLGNLFGFGTVWLGEFSKVFSIICLVLLMNAINMLDGMDGLAGGFVAVALSWFLWVSYETDSDWMVQTVILLLIPLLAFLALNARYPGNEKASIFLGDAGSLSLALVLGWIAIHCVINSPVNPYLQTQLMPPVFIIWVMSVPIIETFSIFFTRMKQGRSPFQPDRLHLHYVLQDRGWTPRWITPFILLIAVTTSAIGYFAVKVGIPDYILLYVWTALLLGITYFRLQMFAKKS